MEPNSSVGIMLSTYCEAENIPNSPHAIESLNLNSTSLVMDNRSPDETQNIINDFKTNHFFRTRLKKMGHGIAI